MRLTHLDLFSGIGGFAIAAQENGFETIGFSEIEPYACQVLKRNWPDIPNYGDIRNIRGVRADLITGGFPCQPFSVVGEQRGAEDDRHLWPEMCRVIAEARPTWVLGENVPGIVTMELDNCLSDLEAIGYAAWPIIIPACAVDARHRRDRVWIVAYAGSARLEGHAWNGYEGDEPGRNSEEQDRPTCPRRLLPGGWREVVFAAECDPDGDGLCPCGLDYSDECSQPGPTQEGYEYLEQGGVLYGRPEETGVTWQPEPAMGRVVNGIPNRAHRLRGLGNAIVPQVASEIIRAIRLTYDPQ
jgi:DNA (cytosine-5)-methyltransferase 1